MSARRRLPKNGTLQPDHEPDAEPITYAMRCAVRSETSPPGTDFAERQNWVFAHGGRNPSHDTYREITIRPWRGLVETVTGRVVSRLAPCTSRC